MPVQYSNLNLKLECHRRCSTTHHVSEHIAPQLYRLNVNRGYCTLVSDLRLPLLYCSIKRNTRSQMSATSRHISCHGITRATMLHTLYPLFQVLYDPRRVSRYMT